MGALAFFIGLLGQLHFGGRGIYELIKSKPSISLWFLVVPLIIILPIPVKYWFFSSYSGQEVSAYEFLIKWVWVTFWPFVILGTIFRKISTNASNVFYACLLSSAIYLFILDEHLILFFNIVRNN